MFQKGNKEKVFMCIWSRLQHSSNNIGGDSGLLNSEWLSTYVSKNEGCLDLILVILVNLSNP